jgi:heavy metal translocating P-type ATPase
LTGESLPIDLSVGSKVFASTLLVSGTVHLRAEKVGSDTTLERIIQLVEAAQKHQSKIATIGEKFGKLYLIVMFVVAFGLYAITQNLSLVLAVVLVVCADDIAVAIPLAQMGAIGTAAKRGVVIKGGAYLEVLGRAKTFVFDKTGTLTTGKLTVSDTVPCVAVSPEELLILAFSVNQQSKHPLARAIIAHALERSIVALRADAIHTVNAKGVIARVENATITTGRASFLISEGITIPESLSLQADVFAQQGKSLLFVAKEKTALGCITFSDQIKPEAKAALKRLRALGATRLIMLSGDNEYVAHMVGSELGLDSWKSGLLPEDKIAAIETFKKEGEVVMVGDGVNDAAALTAAHVGVAMGAIGYDTAIESADIVLMRDDLSELPATVALARRARKISVEDFFIWGATNTLGLVLVFGGIIGPAGAAAYNFISDFFPLINSIRTRRDASQ